MKCTAAQAVDAFSYWLGYYEKASKVYITRRDKEVFELDKGSANYTYPGYICGISDGAWCAMMVSTAILEACGNSVNDAKTVMYGLWPYTACNQLYDMAPVSAKGRRDSFKPQPGDVIIFSSNGSTREHTGMVYAVEGRYVYTMEGNSSNMCKKRSYLLDSSYIYGYVRPNYAQSSDEKSNLTNQKVEQYGAVVCKDPELHFLSKGCAGPEVKTIQRILYSRGLLGKDQKDITVDGDFGKNTEFAVMTLQMYLGLEVDGKVGKETWTKALKELDN